MSALDDLVVLPAPFCNASAGDREWLREAGHEPCAHGWRWAEERLLSREAEAERIRRAVELMERDLRRG